MNEPSTCDYCGDEVEIEPVLRGERTYCCEACAFEASRSSDCGGRTDSTVAPPVVDR